MEDSDRGKYEEKRATEEGELMTNADEAKGRAKEAAGALKGDSDLKREGKIDQAAGKAKDSVDKASKKVKDALKK
jgi:uncharacterized protein YjbJ (UPF0337 family)